MTIPAAVGDSGVKVLVGGDTAIFVDFAHVLSAKLPLFIALVVILSFILLSIVFRSFVIPLIGGRHEPALHRGGLRDPGGGRPVGRRRAPYSGSTGPVRSKSFLPVMLFAILFGLSMDYQVFLVTRMHEEYLKSGDNRIAVRNGLAATGKTITAAALIMILVFGSFILGGQVVIKEFGIGLAGGILVDAVFIRMAVVPSIMMLLGQGQLVVPEAARPDPAHGSPWRPMTSAARVEAAAPSRPQTRSPAAGSARSGRRSALPGVVLGRGLVAREDLVEAGQHLVVQRDARPHRRAVSSWSGSAGPDDRAPSPPAGSAARPGRPCPGSWPISSQRSSYCSSCGRCVSMVAAARPA